MMNSPESLANEFTRYAFKGANMFDILPVYEELTQEDANARLRELFDWESMSVSVVKSGGAS
ncbi:hypothetical protein D3C76_1502830 [compost metagenome]